MDEKLKRDLSDHAMSRIKTVSNGGSRQGLARWWTFLFEEHPAFVAEFVECDFGDEVIVYVHGSYNNAEKERIKGIVGDHSIHYMEQPATRTRGGDG